MITEGQFFNIVLTLLGFILSLGVRELFKMATSINLIKIEVAQTSVRVENIEKRQKEIIDNLD